MAIVAESYTTALPLGSASDVTFDKPTGVADGDVLVAVVRSDSSPTMAGPDGSWVEIAQNAVTNRTIGMFYKVISSAAGEPSTYTFTYSFSAGTRGGGIIRFSGVDNTTPSDCTASVRAGTSTTHIYSSITTATDGAMLIGCVTSNNGGFDPSPPAELSELWQIARSAFSNGIKTTAGATGDLTGTQSSVSYNYNTILGALRPASAGGTNDLTAQDITAGTPVVDTPTLAHIHVLASQDVATQAPTVDAATLGQTHVLTSQDVTAGTLTVDAPTLAQTHSLTAQDVTAGVPVVDTPTLSESGHTLTAQDVTAGTPTIDTAALGQVHVLTAQDVTGATPTVDSPALAQVHILAAQDVTAGTPTIDTPTLSETGYALTAQDVTAGVPTVDAPTIGQVQVLTAQDISTGAPVVDAPTLGQVHILAAQDVTGGTPTVDNPILGEAGILPTFTVLTSGGTITDAFSFETGSITPEAGKVHLLICSPTGDHAGDFTTAPTITGCNITEWELQETAGQGEATKKRLFCFHCVPASPTTGTLTIDFGSENIADIGWTVIKLDNTNTTNNGADAFDTAFGYASRRDSNVVTEGKIYIPETSHPDAVVFTWMMGLREPTYETGITHIVNVDFPAALINFSVATVDAGYDHRPFWTYTAGADHLAYAAAILPTGATPKPLRVHKLLREALSTDTTNYSFSSITATANRVVVAGVLSAKSGGSAGPSSVRIGTGNTFTQIATVSQGDLTLTVWRAKFASNTTFAFQVLHAAAQDGCAVNVIEFTGMDATGTNGSGAIVQSDTGSAAATTSLALTLASFGDTDNGTLAFFAQADNWNALFYPEILPDANLGMPFFRVIDPGQKGANTPSIGLDSLWQATPNVAPGADFQNSADALGIAVEIAASTATTDELTAQDVVSGTPAIDSPTLAQVHTLTAQDVTAGTPTLDNPTIGQVHVLAAQDVVAQAPTVDSPVLAQVHALIAQDIVAGTPTVDAPTLAEGLHVLTAQDVTSGTPTVDSPTIGQVHALIAQDVAASSPTVDAPTLTQVHALVPQDVTTGSPAVDTPTLTSGHGLLAQDVFAGVPTIDMPTLAQVHGLVAQNVSTTPVIDSATLGQIHVLLALGVFAGIPTIDTPTVNDTAFVAAVPVERTIVVEAEDRDFGVPSDIRTYTFSDIRTYTIER